MHPIFATPISCHHKCLVELVTVREPINTTTRTWLPLNTECVCPIKVVCNQLMGSTDGICLESLLFCTSDWFTRLCLSKVCTIKERIDRCIAAEFDSFVPMVGNQLSVAIFGKFAFINWSCSGWGAILCYTRSNLNPK